MIQKRIGDFLVEAGVLTREQLDRAIRNLAIEGEGRVASELLRLGLAHERQVAQALSSSAGHPALVLSESTLSFSGLAFVPKVVAEQHRLLPVALDDTTVTVAVADVDSRPIFEQVSFACARRVVRLLCAEQLLEATIQEAYARFGAGETLLRGARSKSAEAHLEVMRTPVRQDADDAAAFVAELSTHIAATPLEQLRAFAGGATGVTAKLRPSPSPETSAAASSSSDGRFSVVSDDERTKSSRAPSTLTVPVLATPGSGPITKVHVPASDKPVVIVVEDDAGIRRLLGRALTHDGYHVLESESGDGGAALLRAHKPSLLVLDAMLPGMHGFELCARLKAAPGYSDVPVLMISAIYTGWEKAREILEEHRADAFVEKPFDIHYVRKLASELVGRPLTRRLPEGERAQAIASLRAKVERHQGESDWRGALDEVKRWLELDAFDPLAWLEKGNLLSQQRDLDGAMRAYEAAVVYDSRSFPALTNLALAYDRLGFARKASEAWQRALVNAPDEGARERIRERLASRA